VTLEIDDDGDAGAGAAVKRLNVNRHDAVIGPTMRRNVLGLPASGPLALHRRLSCRGADRAQANLAIERPSRTASCHAANVHGSTTYVNTTSGGRSISTEVMIDPASRPILPDMTPKQGALLPVATWLGVPVVARSRDGSPGGLAGIGASRVNESAVRRGICRPASRSCSLQAVEAGSYARPGYPPNARSRTPSGPGRILRRAVGPTRMMWSASSLYAWPSTCTSAEPRSAI
jgi:hypothetical protein